MAGFGNAERDNAVQTSPKSTYDRITQIVEAVERGAEPDLCECGPMTVATGHCSCNVLDEPLYRKKDENSFYFFETLLDEAHPASKRFYDHLLEAALLHRDKQRDYGKETDPFANVRASEEWGIPGWVGCMVRANDKIRRLQTLATEGTLTNESAKDSFIDLAVYALIGLCLYEQSLGS